MSDEFVPSREQKLVSIAEMDKKMVYSTRWGMHGSFAMYFAAIPVLLFILSFPARLPKGIKIKSLVLIGLILLIFATAVFSEEIGFAASVHSDISLGLFLNAMLIMRGT